MSKLRINSIQHNDSANVNMELLPDGNVNIAGEPAATQTWVANDGVTGLREIITFTADGSFVKADYPWLRAVRARVQGGGGGGGGAASPPTNSETSFGDGGGAGGYAEKLILASALGASEAVGVGTLGSGGTAGGSSATGSNFAGLTTNGGSGGSSRAPTATHFVTPAGSPAPGGSAAGGDINRTGDSGFRGLCGVHGSNAGVASGPGGSSPFGSGGASRNGSGDGYNANGYGAGGSGASNATSANPDHVGGNGSPGIVVLELYG